MKENKPERELDAFRLILLSVLVGIVTGLGTAVFRGLIAFFHNLFFLGKFSLVYNANVFTPSSPWGPFIVMVPVLGALGVAFLVKNFAPEAEGHGAPEVIDAIYYNKGKIRPVVGVIKSLASALSIGTGGSTGREGPMIQIGSSFGSTVAQILGLCTWQRIVMVAAGAGGGIAAIFNTPIGGILFAAEIMMSEISVRTLVPVAISTEVAVYIARLIFGPNPTFMVPRLEITLFHHFHPWVLLIYAVLGALIGIVSAIYIKSIYGFEDFFKKRINGSYYRRHMLGMLVVGILMYMVFRAFGHYYIEGVGYSTVQSVLSNNLTTFYLLLLLFVLKLLSVSLTLGSGASGGIFSPGIFMGATFGGAFGVVVHLIFPGIGVNSAAFVLAGMAGIIGGSTGAALTSIVMIFEMTLDYNVIIPMTVTVAISCAVRTVFEKDTIYTKKLTRRGRFAPTALQANYHQLHPANLLMEKNIGFIDESTRLKDFLNSIHDNDQIAVYLIKDSTGNIVSFIDSDMIKASGPGDPQKTVADLGDKRFIVVSGSDLLSSIVSEMRGARAEIALVAAGRKPASAENILGIISEQGLLDAMNAANELFYARPHRKES
jgi:CIC family chloride channel protein